MKSKANFNILNPRLDANFKAIFTQNTKESRNALRSFLSAAIGREVVSVTVIENEKSKDYDEQRGIDYDINCEFSDGNHAQVEMQGYERKYNYGNRAEYYAARIISSTIEVGNDWSEVPQVYQISVLNFKYDKSNENPTHHYVMCDLKDNAKLSDRLNIIFLELPKLPEIKTPEEAKNLPTLLKWCKFLQEADNPNKQDLIDELTRSEEGIMNAESTLKGISMDSWRWFFQGKEIGREADRISEARAYEREIAAAKQELQETRQQVAEAQQQVADAKQQVADANQQVAEAQQHVADANQQVAEAQQQVADAKQQVAEAQQQTADAKQQAAHAKQQTAIANAKNLLKETSLSAEQIARCCTLPLEQVLALKEELSHELTAVSD